MLKVATSSDPRDRLRRLLEDYAARYPSERHTVARFCAFIARHPRCFERSLASGHITASAWLVNRRGDQVLLTHHRKLGRWLQPGGHSDGNPDPLDVAITEAQEESGLRVAPLNYRIFDLDIHKFPMRGQEPAHFHFDVRFALRVTHSETFQVSSESLALAWVPIAELHQYTEDPSLLRMAHKWSHRRRVAAPEVGFR